MQFYIFNLSDQGFELLDGTALQEIDGLDNLPPQDGDNIDLRFQHRGASGYPEGTHNFFDSLDSSKTLAVFEAGVNVPEGGVVVAEADVISLLVSECGWPDDSYLDSRGMPKAPEPGVVNNV